MQDPNLPEHLQFLANGGEMADIILNKDWSQTSLGPIETWDPSLRTTLGIILHSAFPMFVFWGEDMICFYNDAYRPSLGVDGKHPAIGEKGKDVWPDAWDIIGPLIEQVITTTQPVYFQDKLVSFYRNGRMEDVYWTFCYSALFDQTGRVNGVFVTCTETTETVLARRELDQRQRRLRSVISQVPVAIAIFRGSEFVTEIANAKALDIWNKEEDEVLNKPILEVLPDLNRQGFKAILNDVYETGSTFKSAENRVTVEIDGVKEEIFVNFSYEPLYNSNDEIDGIMAVGVEVTDQVMSRKTTEESERKFRLLADSMPQYIWTADTEGNLNYFNQSVFDYSGLSPEQVASGGWLQIVHPDDREENIRIWTEAISTGKDFLFEHRFLRHDGTYRWQLSRAKPQRDEANNIRMWVGTSTDIQEQKDFRDELERQVAERTAELQRLNESLKKSEERYHLMVEEVQDYAILYLNREGIVENWNSGAEKIKGYKASEIVGKSFSTFYTTEDRKRGLPMILLNMAMQQGKAKQEGWRVKKGGTRFWASVVITAVHNDKRELIGFSKVTHDLTEKKEAADALEVNRMELEEKNIELQKMNKELQSFAYISSHDLQEPLRKIQTFASRILEKERSNLSESGKELFVRMQRSAEQMQALINDLLAYSRTNTAEHVYQKVSLKNVINRIKEDFQEELEEKQANIVLINPLEVEVIDFQFQQMFFNLISNSIKFSRPEVPLKITIFTELVPGESVPSKHIPPDREYWHLSISDNGIGFEQEYEERIFGLFQRLHGKSEYKGTGIGLAIVKKIAENHGGFITAKGEVNKGATFDIYFPVERG